MSLKDLIISEGIPDRITNVIVGMLSSNFLPFYAEFCFNINFIKAKIKTCAITVTSNGMYFLWSEEFIDSLTDAELAFVIVHEIFHILFDHPKRSVGYDHKISNIAQDMIINSTIWSDVISQSLMGKNLRDRGVIDSPRDKEEIVDCPYCKGKFNDEDFSIDTDEKKKNCGFCRNTGKIGKNIGVYVPKDYGGEWIFEDLYFWILEKYNTWREDNKVFLDLDIDSDCDDGGNCGGITINVKDKDGNIKNVGESDYGLYGKANENKYQSQPIDTHSLDDVFKHIEINKGLTLDEHLPENCPEEVRKQIVGNVLSRMKNAGYVTNEIEAILGKLQKKKEDHLKYIKRSVTLNILGHKKNRTITRPNRREIFGLKGKRKYTSEINCVLDVSGSMSGTFEEVLSYIFQKDIAINLIQCDAEVKDHIKIRKMSDLPKMKIRGLGGTILQPGLDYITKDKHLNSLNTVILTDGYLFSDLNFSKVKGYNLIITTGTTVKYTGTTKIKHIIVNDKTR